MSLDRGSAVVEFALVVPLLLVVILAIAELAVVARTEIQLVHASREGARQAATSPDTRQAASAARRALGALGPRARVSVTRPVDVGEPAMVRIRLTHRVAAPIFGGFDVTLGAATTMRTER
jgi:Flp pilus assembly protein TadG